MEKKYNHLIVEKGKYDDWLNKELFKPSLKGKPFSIVLPPPNITGHLHLGHALNGTIQDSIIRYKKLQGFRTIWVPGTDHAGIATQTKFQKYLLTEKNIDYRELGREKFVSELMEWKESHSKFIHSQWRNLGLSLDYSSELFTMDKSVNNAVNKVFCELYQNNLIYEGEKLVNWDVKLQTAISDIEVIHKQVISKLYYFKYYLKDKNEYITISTTRPETMFGDVAVFVNPTDERYKHLVNEIVINPVNNQELKILTDPYIEIEFGTGIMKCTPSHDFNDNILGKKHKLPSINIMNNDGTMNSEAGEFEGLDRIKCRKLLVEKLAKNSFVEKIDEKYETQIGFSERTDEIVEPIISKQWFIKMKPLVKNVINNQKRGSVENKVKIYPDRFDKNLINWLVNIEDWCISRQLWWGHQLPVWINSETNEVHVSEKEPKPIKNWTRHSDVLDTWFSSAIWPLVCFEWPKDTSTKFKTFFPTDMMVTGHDILYFWISRMMTLSSYFTNKIPFKNVYIHGLIRDEKGKKMSKSLNNGIDPNSVIDEYGADALRYFLTSSSSVGEDIKFSNEKIRSNWNFLNKIWNSARFIFLNSKPNKNYKIKIGELSDSSKWILKKLNKVIKNVSKNMDKYNFVLASKTLYDFIWNDFCNNYIEFTKINTNNKMYAQNEIAVAQYVLKQILIMLHPQCPFLTEEIYSYFYNPKISILKEKWPVQLKIGSEKIINKTIDIITAINQIRAEENLSNNEFLEINILTKKDIKLFSKITDKINDYLFLKKSKIVSVTNVGILANKYTKLVDDFVIEVYAKVEFHSENEISKIEKMIIFLEKEIKRSNEILSNENFITKAPKNKIDEEKTKLENYKGQLNSSLESLKSLKIETKTKEFT